MTSDLVETGHSEGGPPPLRNQPTVASGVTGNAHPAVPVSPSGPVPTGPSAGRLAAEDAAVQYEQVAARLLSLGETGHFSLAVTSTVSGEGVSTVCVGLAFALAKSTSREVLLIDANLRRPSLHEMLGKPMGPGLHELLAGKGDPDHPEMADSPMHTDVRAFRTKVPNLWLLPSGASMEYPAQLMTSEAAKGHISHLRDRFDFVIIDCPPVLSAVDTASICRLADGVVLVLRSGLIPRDEVTRAKNLLEGATILGVILNGV
jgi:capsular exopolysaccharide synthesis family protein